MNWVMTIAGPLRNGRRRRYFAAGFLCAVGLLLAAGGAAGAPAVAAEAAQSKVAPAPSGAATPGLTVVPPAAAAPPASPATLLTELQIAPGRALLVMNGSVGRYDQFMLDKPQRLIVDLFGLKPVFKQKLFAANTGIRQIRVGAHNDKVRLVFDAEGTTLPGYAFARQAGGLEVTWGNSGSGTAVAPTTASTAPAAARPAAPAVVAAATPAAAAPVAATAPATVKKAPESEGPVTIEGLDFENRDGRSTVVITLSAPAKITQPEQIGNLVRFDVGNATISRALRRTIDAGAFPSAVSTVTPYVISNAGKPAVRIAVELKGKVPYKLVNEGRSAMLVMEDEAFAEAAPPPLTTKEIEVPAVPAPAVAGAKVVANPTEPAPHYTGQKISLVFDNADIRSILQLIGDVSGLNILASNDVKGEITLRLIDVPWDQALDLVMETHGLDKIQEGNVIRIMPVDKIRERTSSSLKMQREEFDEGLLETRAFAISYSKVEDARKFLSDLSSKRGTITPDARNKQLIVKDVPRVLAQMADMISRIDQPERQVMIEARIVEAGTNFIRDLGVKWGASYKDEGSNNGDINNAQLGLGGAFLVPLPVSGVAAPGLAAGITFAALDGDFNLNLRLSALEQSGEGKIISTPRVTTLNGQKAIIAQGTKIPYTTVSDQGAGTEFENAELKLEVTPEINPDGSVILDVKASNSSVGTVYQSAGGGDAPAIDERKAETKVLVRNGQTTVIGGIFVERETDSASGVPWLKDIPWVGGLFRSTNKTKERKELLIFITPRIVES